MVFFENYFIFEQVMLTQMKGLKIASFISELTFNLTKLIEALFETEHCIERFHHESDKTKYWEIRNTAKQILKRKC